MKSIKCLITSGCSLSEKSLYAKTWPFWLKDYFDPDEFLNTGRSSSGNEYIARKAIYSVSESLKKHKPEDITVLIMWSTLSRKAFIVDDSNILNVERMRRDREGNYPDCHTYQGSDIKNVPVVNTKEPSWIWFNAHWNDEPIQDWYINYDNIHQQLERTVWDMLQVQNYCNIHGVSYYWMSVNGSFEHEYNLIKSMGYDTNYVDYLIESLDKTLCIDKDIAHWVKSNCPENMPSDDETHPLSEGHKEYTKSVIVPFLEQRFKRSELIEEKIKLMKERDPYKYN